MASDRSEGYQRRTSALVVASSISTALMLFAVFRLTGEMLAVEWIGAWSLIQGLFLITRVSDSGAGANISRVVAVRAKTDASLDLRNFTVASLLIASLPSLLLSALSAPLIAMYVTTQFAADLDRRGLSMLVGIALLNAALAAASNVLLAICEGAFQLNYKSLVVISSNVVGICLIVPLLQIAGPAGLGWVYVAVSATQCSLAAVRVAVLAKPGPRIERVHVKRDIQLLWRENLDLTGISLIRLSFEPSTKFLLSLFAPLIVIAQFELALRVTTQIRVVIQSALQPLLVVGARASELVDASTSLAFLKNDRVLSTLALGGVIAQIVAAPAIQWAGLGSHDDLFTAMFVVLALGNALNIMGLSGYFWQLTSGSLSPLVKIQGVMAVVNVVIGAIGLTLGSALFVVGAYALAFAIGGLATRSLLRGIPTSMRIVSPMVVVVGGVSAAILVFIVEPVSSIRIVALFCGATATGVVSLYAAYLSARRGGRRI
jgi:hypothetical protein